MREKRWVFSLESTPCPISSWGSGRYPLIHDKKGDYQDGQSEMKQTQGNQKLGCGLGSWS